jgi:hypothetical protein
VLTLIDTDTLHTEGAAPVAAPVLLTRAQAKREGERLAARLLDQLAGLIAEVERWKQTSRRACDAGHGLTCAEGAAFDVIVDAFLAEVPGLRTLPGASYEACAAFAQALFGPDLVPNDADPEREGAFAHDAFQVARAYMAAPKNSPACDLLLAAAVAVSRDTVSRQRETETATQAP